MYAHGLPLPEDPATGSSVPWSEMPFHGNVALTYYNQKPSPQKSLYPEGMLLLSLSALDHSLPRSAAYNIPFPVHNAAYKFFLHGRFLLPAILRGHLQQMHQLHEDHRIPYSLHRRIYRRHEGW